jgi:O-antigen/teichoic acid export membrane protein
MAGTVLGFLSTMVIARWMGAAALGTIGYLLGLLGLLSVCLDMGFAFAHLKRVSESHDDPAALIGTFLAIKLGLATFFLMAALLLPVARGLGGQTLFQNSSERTAYYVIAATYILHSLSSVFLFTFEARLETAKEGLAAFAGSLVSFLVKAAAALLGLGVVALSGGYLIEPVTLLVCALFLFRGYRIARPRREHLQSYVHYTLPITLNTAITLAIANVNPVFIRSFWSNVEVGYYASVLGFASLLDRVAMTVATLFLPQASNDAARGDWGEIRRRLRVIERYVLTLLVPLAVLLVFFRKEIVVIALGAEFVAATPILTFLVFKSIVTAVFQPYGTVLYAIEKQKYLVISSLVSLLTLLAADALLVPRRLGGWTLPGLGGAGAALALALMSVAGGLVQARVVSRSAHIEPYWKALGFFVAGALMYGLMWGGSRLVHVSIWLQVPALTALGLASYLLTLAALGLFTRDDARVYLNVLHPQRMLEYVSTELDGHA